MTNEKPKGKNSGNVEAEIRSIVQSHLHKKGWDVLYRLNVEVSDTENLIEAGINRENWMIHYLADPLIGDKLEDMIRQEGIRVECSKEKLLCAGADHEEGHWRVCPFDRDYVEDILHGISAGLKNAGLSGDEIVQYAPDVANLFMDFIDNSVNGLDAKDGVNFSDGISLFYLNQLRKPNCSAGYALFVDAQMKVYGRKGIETKVRPRGLLGRIFGKEKSRVVGFREMAESHSSYKKIAKDVKSLIATVLPSALADKAYERGVDSYDSRLLIDEFTKRDLWGKKAEAFAKVFAPYAKEVNKENNSSCEGNGEGQGKTGKQNKSKQGSESNKGKHEHKGRCNFVRELLEDPEARKDILRRALSKGRKAGPEGIPYFSQQESFEAAYESAVEEIVLKYFKDDDDNENPAFDLFHMKDRKLEEDEIITGRLNWGKTLFVNTSEGKELWLHKREVPYQIEEEMLPGRKSLEDVLFVVDVSGSMGWSGKPLDGSKYDLALQSIFGCLRGLEKMGRAAHARYGLVLFSNSTEFSGWEEYYGLDKFKRLVFTGYQGQGTHLNSRVMQKALQGNNNRFLTILISDGEISNTDAPETIKKVVDAGNDVVQFSIQGSTDFSKKIKNYGAEIVQVNKPEDLAGIVLEKVKERYK
ncbi:VWA domain-containing protein [Candidatus Woesearchaeota archaeon]|nr:VWA domain-containing protein [Candidatus Woesearchaeota archaeon]